jgi:simple sugar transport system ATP-binding protein
MMKAPLALEAIGVSKRFGGVLALDEVSVKLAASRMHALLGENGAGKSTLVKCLMGYYQADSGQFLLHGREHQSLSPRDAHRAGIGMVCQHFTLAPGMTVAENLILARSHIPLRINWKRELADLERLLQTMPFRVPLRARAAHLSAGEKQKVEILKQLYLGHRLLILDEPTSVLTPQEADEVLGLLRGMAQRGEVTVVMITHKFREVLEFADEVTVLRRGRKAGQGPVAGLNPSDLADMMMGQQPAAPKISRQRTAPSARSLSIRGLTVLDDHNEMAVRDLSLQVRGGEILGIAGVSGNGQRELVEVLAGQRELAAGDIAVHGEAFNPARAANTRLHIACLPEEPVRNACVAEMSVADNLALRGYHAAPLAWMGWWRRGRAIKRHAQAAIAAYRIKAGSPDAPVSSLSGGNVQRLVLARELGREVGLLVAANPCFGLDFAAVARIHDHIMRVRNAGAAVLLVAEDLDELLELSDRVVVMFEGRILLEVDAATASRAAIGRAMAGSAPDTVNAEMGTRI